MSIMDPIDLNEFYKDDNFVYINNKITKTLNICNDYINVNVNDTINVNEYTSIKNYKDALKNYKIVIDIINKLPNYYFTDNYFDPNYYNNNEKKIIKYNNNYKNDQFSLFLIYSFFLVKYYLSVVYISVY